MSYCKKCGTQLTEDQKFCSGCGEALFTENRESKWDGGVLETAINTIIASIICTLTFGLGTPWAICYVINFIVSHAVIDGQRYTFDGKGGQLFGQWIKWFVLMIITCGIYSFWVAPRMYNWVASHLHKVDDK